MKVKYYLRGLGVGLVVTALIFIVAFFLYQPTMSDEEIITAAKALGMVMEEDASETTDTSDTEDADETADATEDATTEVESSSADDTADGTASTEAASVSETDDNTDTSTEATGEVVEFAIVSGQSSAMVCTNLYNEGLVDNAEAFDDYLNENGYDNFMQPGTYEITKGSSYKEVATIITQGKLE